MKNTILILGDILAIAVVTVIGFATHGEADLSFLPRMLASFLPLTLAWFLLAPWFGLFQPEVTSNPRQLWRPVLAMLFAAPLAALLRGLWLNAPIIPVFAVVLASTSALGILLWRGIYLVLSRR
jgi:ABC-type xylose transport system permease subunit